VATIKLEKVRKVFGPGALAKLPGQKPPQSDTEERSRIALDSVDLVVHDSETMVVLGPSGCGKSTLLRVVAGLERYEGHVYFDGKLMDKVPPYERSIGMVFQGYALYPHLDGFDNLGFTFKARKRPSEEAMERILVTAEIMGVGFEELLRHKPGRLAGGEQQRLAVGRALVREPELFLFDEPLSNLDAALRLQTRGEIRRILRRFRHTAIYVTHDQTEATAIGDQLAIMKAGRIEQVGTYAVLYDTPINAFVAGFLGNPAMNLLRGTLNEGGSWQLRDVEVAIPAFIRDRLRVGWKLILGIRPEQARLAEDESPTYHGRVVHIERDMPRRIQTLYLAHPPLPDIAITIPADKWIERGDWVPVLLPLEKLTYFDGKTETRIG
jgi:ABC-type sugar transport system ATPase subunit